MTAFHVDLPGLLRVFGGHLYSNPGVFVRELVQNAVDAIVERRRGDLAFRGQVRVRGDAVRMTVEVDDDGIGLDEGRIEECLAKIGYSSKLGADDVMGRFGIGLLSGFLVAREIVVETLGPAGRALRWRGRPDGTYEVEPGTRTSRGTTVTLAVMPQHARYTTSAMLHELLERYVRWLPFDVMHDDVRVTSDPPWLHGKLDRWIADQAFRTLATIPVAVRGADGVLWITEHGGADTGGRVDVMLRGMLLEAGARRLLPAWASFVGGIVQAVHVSPTASRETFVDDDAAAALAGELRAALLDGLRQLAADDPARFARVLAAHYLALRGACVDTPELIDAIGDRMPFDTNVGRVDLRTLAAMQPERILRYVQTQQDFAHTAPLANAQGLVLVNASFVHDVAFLRAWAELRGYTLVRLSDTELDLLIQPATELYARFAVVLAVARDALESFDVAPELGRFEPGAMPAFVVSDATRIEQRAASLIRHTGSPLVRSLVSNLDAVKRAATRLVLNANSKLVRALPDVADAGRVRRVVRMLYFQSAMMLHRTLSVAETRAFAEDLLGLVEHDVAPEIAHEPEGLN